MKTIWRPYFSALRPKPHLRLDPTRPGTGKWECTSHETGFLGGLHVRCGKGYSPALAFLKWLRCRSVGPR